MKENHRTRISRIESDPGYVKNYWDYEVFFNGEKFEKDFIVADSNKGFIKYSDIIINQYSVNTKLKKIYGEVIIYYMPK